MRPHRAAALTEEQLAGLTARLEVLKDLGDYPLGDILWLLLRCQDTLAMRDEWRERSLQELWLDVVSFRGRFPDLIDEVFATDQVLTGDCDLLSKGIKILFPDALIEATCFPSGAVDLGIRAGGRFVFIQYTQDRGFGVSEITAASAAMDAHTWWFAEASWVVECLIDLFGKRGYRARSWRSPDGEES